MTDATGSRVAVVTAVFALTLDEGETAADRALYIENRLQRILLDSTDSVHIDSVRETRRR